MTDKFLAQLKNPDHLRVSKNTTFLSTLEKSNKTTQHEKVIWSDTVEKRNHRGAYQKRDLIITSRCLYNFKRGSYKDIRRKINLTNLHKIVLNTRSKECLVKVYNDYDYWYKIVNIAEALKILTEHYKEGVGSELPIQPVTDSLANHLTTKRDLASRKKTEPAETPPIRRPTDIKNTCTPKLEGWLAKCGYSVSNKYLPRYFQLVDNTMLYHSVRFKGSVKLGDSFVSPIKFDAKETMYKFSVITPGKTIVLGAPKKKVCGAWVVRIARVLVEHRGKAKTSSQREEDVDKDTKDGSTRKNDAKDTKKHHRICTLGSDRAIALKDDADTVYYYQGWLLKEEPRTGNMRRRLIMLTGDVLAYYETELKGNIPLTQGSAVTETTVQETLMSVPAGFDFVQTRFKYRFTVGKADRLYKMAADTEDKLHEWLSAIESTLGNAPTLNNSLLMTDDLKGYMNQEAPSGKVCLVFTDVQSSTKLWENRKMEMAEGIGIHDNILRELLKKHRGYEVRTEGDAFFVSFFTIDNALNWCFEAQLELLKADWPENLLTFSAALKEPPYWAGVRVRMGLHIGSPVCKRNPVHGRMEYFGPVVNEADRMADSGHGGQVICTKEAMEAMLTDQKANKSTLKLTSKWLGKYPFEGVKDNIDLYQLIHPELKDRGVTSPGVFPELRIDWSLPNAPEATHYPGKKDKN